ncbi:MAG: hypothetical protein Q8O41_06215 [Candidatus Methanoperedens sp.]|nr:hypothetical protein [Candidatus Methanoperedens sp.]
MTNEFLHSREYMRYAFEHLLAYLERYLAGTPEYVILRAEKSPDEEIAEKIRRIRE